MKKFKKVSAEEFDKFILYYPKKLDRDLCRIGEPPILSYNDFTLGKWPDSVVARCWMDDYLEEKSKTRTVHREHGWESAHTESGWEVIDENTTDK